MEKVFNREGHPIGIFDSGVGGITVLKEALRLLPNENYVYYADSFNAPYGIKSREEVEHLVRNAVCFLAETGVKALVLACNTATSVAAASLRRLYDIPVLGMEPAVKPAVKVNEKGRRVLVIATPLTLSEEKFRNLVEAVDSRHVVDFIPAPELVEYTENGDFSKRSITAFVKKRLSGDGMKKYGTVVLGCTHFIFFRNLLKEFLPEGIDIIDGNDGTVRHLKDTLEKNGILNKIGKGSITYYVSGNRDASPEEKRRFQSYLHMAP